MGLIFYSLLNKKSILENKNDAILEVLIHGSNINNSSKKKKEILFS